MAKNKTLMGVLLSKVANVRWEIRRQAAERLWKRNGLDNPTKRQGYKMIEDTGINSDGSEVTTIKLWKLIDKEVVTLAGDIKITTREGVEQGDEYSDRAAPKSNTSSPI